MNYFSRAVLAIICFLSALDSPAKVDPPNYDFSLDQMKVFMPGEPLKKAVAKHGKAEGLKQKGAFKTSRFYVKHIRYKFPVLVQSKDGKITDFYARLPAYFLHNIFHQSLINRLGKQDRYHHKDEQAVYSWESEDGPVHIYSGACTITCFPVYYTVYPKQSPAGNFVPIIKQMQDQENLKLSKD